MLSRLGVQRKLSLLLALPLLAVIIISVPFATSRVDDAVAARSTTDSARRASAVAMLIQDIQQERLLTLTYLVSPNAERGAMRVASAAVSDRVDRLMGELSSPGDNELLSAIGDLRKLEPLRKAALNRSGSALEADKSYHEVVMGLVTALGLTRQLDADVTGLRQLTALDALLRINEDITRLGTSLVIGTVDATSAKQMIIETLLLAEANIAHFRQQADLDQSTLLATVVQGQTAMRINEFARQITTGGLWVTATRALTAAEATLTLTRALQERIARDIAARAEARDADARAEAGVVVGFAVLLLFIVVLMSIAVSRSVSRPLRRLTQAATVVADLARTELVRVADSEEEETRPPKLSAVQVTSSDEIGELALAFNRVQTTAALLMEQQVATRRNVAVMFANVARRTRSLVSRQLSFIDDLERGEQNERVLAKLYRLDHLTTRLHRSADSLLVISGIREDERIVSPAPLVDVVRSAIAEIEGFQSVEVGDICSVTLAPELVSDLRLVLAELLENATAVSPPGTPVTVTAELSRGVRIRVVDRGIGMSADRIAEENLRLVERERLDVVPTSMLGLFVVGRLARRHGLSVQMFPTGSQGVTVEVGLPPALFTPTPRQRGVAVTGTVVEAGSQPRRMGTQPVLELPRYPDPAAVVNVPKLPELPTVTGSFAWFDPRDTPALEAGPQSASRPDTPSAPAATPVSAVTPRGTRPMAPPPPPGAFPPVVAPAAPVAHAGPPGASWPMPGVPTDRAAQQVPPMAQPQPAAPEEPVSPSAAAATQHIPLVSPGGGHLGTAPGAAQVPSPRDMSPPSMSHADPSTPPMRPAGPATPPRGPVEQVAAPQQPLVPPHPSAPGQVPPPAAAASIPPPRAAGAAEAGGLGALVRRNPGSHLGQFGVEVPRRTEAPKPARNAATERDELDAYLKATAEAASAVSGEIMGAAPGADPANGRPRAAAAGVPPVPGPPPAPAPRPVPMTPPPVAPFQAGPAAPRSTPPQPSGSPQVGRNGLVRRVPGAQLSPTLRTGPAKATTAPRNAEAERDALQNFLDGLARAETNSRVSDQNYSTDKSEQR